MKTYLILFFSVFISSIIPVFAQENLKIGHVNIPEIVQQLPETDSLKKVIETETSEMEKMYEEMIQEHDASLKKYNAEKEKYSEFVRNAKESDLLEMAGKIQQFQQNAGQQLQNRNMELFQPVYAKINQAIEKVALKNNFTYILDLSTGTVAFFHPTAQNLNSLVLDELKN
jgi:outer membrane protein